MSSGLAAFAPIVVVPVFNEAETIGEVVAAARAHAPVLVVDDGSDDGSAAAARAAGAEVLRHPRRLGKGQAIRSEEHTSELQSQSNLVCRLLLEKRNQGKTGTNDWH